MQSKSSTLDRHSFRLQGYDYAQVGAYFITIVTHQRSCLFGTILDGEFIPNAVGRIVQFTWNALPAHFLGTDLDAFIVMPNHIHGIVHITERRRQSVGAQHAAPLPRTGLSRPYVQPGSLGVMVRSFKAAVTKRWREIQSSSPLRLWQRNYYEHVIRNENSLIRIRDYVATNPARWSIDPENPFAAEQEPKEVWQLEDSKTPVGAQHAVPLPRTGRT